MKILKRKLVIDKSNTKTELMYLDNGITIVFNVNRFNGVCKAEIYHCTGFDEVGEFQYNTDGIDVGRLNSVDLKKSFETLFESFFNKMQDKDRYKRTMNALL